MPGVERNEPVIAKKVAELWLVWAGFSRGGCSTNQPRLLGKRAVVITCQEQGVPVGDLLDAAAECLQQRSVILPIVVHCFGR